MNALFLIIIILSALVIYRGWSRGIIVLAYGIFSWIFMIAFTAIANPILYNYFMNNEAVHDKVYEFVYPYADASIPQVSMKKETPQREAAPKGVDEDKKSDDDSIHIDKDILEEGAKNLPDALKDLIPEKGVDVPKDLVDKFQENGGISIPDKYQWAVDMLEDYGIDVEEYVDKANDTIENTMEDMRKAAVEKAATEITKRVLKGLALIVSYLISKAVCTVVWFILNLIRKIGPLNKVVHLAGACVGVVESALYIWIIMFVISMVRPSPQGSLLYKQVEANPFLQFMYDKNPLTDIF